METERIKSEMEHNNSSGNLHNNNNSNSNKSYLTPNDFM